jgi:hypothetical protein
MIMTRQASNPSILPMPEPEMLSIRVRGFVPPPKDKKVGGKTRKPAPPSEWTLVFDCETSVDARQRLRFGVYHLYQGQELQETGLFYDPEALSAAELTLLRKVTAERDLKLRSSSEFVDEVFYGMAYEFRASIVGFNLPFDLSRLAIGYGSAKGKMMKGGFSLKLSEKPWRPRVQVRHLNSRAALIQFAKPFKQRTTRGARRRKIITPGRRGSFIDLKTIAAALFSRSFSLGGLAEFLKTPSQKHRTDEHGARLTRAYIDYALQDVQATWECYEALNAKYELHQLSMTGLAKILSEASLGKAYFRQMGIRPFREVQPDFPDHLIGVIMSAYFGGRAEVGWRREIKQVLYCDFLSMYPTVCTLMGLWRFIIAKGVGWRDATEETRARLERLTLADLQESGAWRELTTLVKIAPKADIFPIRAKYESLMAGARKERGSATIGLNMVSGSSGLWFTLADVIASKLLNGRTPEILEAIRFEPLEPQAGLKPIFVSGNPDYRVDPYNDDLFKRVIELRQTVKAKLKIASAGSRDALKAEEQALKILANSTSYGIFVEINVTDLDETDNRICFGPSGKGFSVETTKLEEPGRYFHPLLATLITGAARLMLGIAERLTLEEGLDWAFCDTDSMAIAKPEEMSNEDFFVAAQNVREWFNPLNPYSTEGPLFKIEDANFHLGSNGKELAPLFCLAISAKRYVLFNLDAEGQPIIRKASAHGLGHLLPPYGEQDAPGSIPAPQLSLNEIGVERWQYDLWFQIICGALEGHPDEVDPSYHPALDKPAASRYGATTPKLLRWFKTYNQNRAYRDQVKPFNFLLAFQAKERLGLAPKEEMATPKKGRRRKALSLKPVAAFDKDVIRASRDAFDRETGKPIPSEDLKTYRPALAGYHLSAEAKFGNGDHFDRGRTQRRHLRVANIIHIGKEANKWEEQYFTGLNVNEQIEYGTEPDFEALDEQLHRLVEASGEREAARRLGLARDTVRKAQKFSAASLGRRLIGKIAIRLQKSS